MPEILREKAPVRRRWPAGALCGDYRGQPIPSYHSPARLRHGPNTGHLWVVVLIAVLTLSGCGSVPTPSGSVETNPAIQQMEDWVQRIETTNYGLDEQRRLLEEDRQRLQTKKDMALSAGTGCIIAGVLIAALANDFLKGAWLLCAKLAGFLLILVGLGVVPWIATLLL